MSNREVAGLQALAKKHGGELTVNPDTGLPEAGFLDSLIPTIAGAGLTYFSGGAINPMMAAGIVGGISALDSKDLGKGLMAGLGAWGGGSMVGGLAGMGLVEGAATATTPASEAAMTAAVKDNAYKTAVGEGASKFGNMFANKPMETIASFGGGSGLNAARTLFAASAPAIMADQNVKTTTPSPNRGMIRPQTFSRQQTYPQQEYAGPVSGERRYFNDSYTAGDPYAAANGGLVALARGGYAGATPSPAVGPGNAYFESPEYKAYLKANSSDDPFGMIGTGDMYDSPYFGSVGSGSLGRQNDRAYESYLGRLAQENTPINPPVSSSPPPSQSVPPQENTPTNPFISSSPPPGQSMFSYGVNPQSNLGRYDRQSLFRPTTPLLENNMYGASRDAYNYLMGVNPTSGGGQYPPYDPIRDIRIDDGKNLNPNTPKTGKGRYEFDPITGQYKWIPDPITPVNIAPPVFQPTTQSGGGGGGGRSPEEQKRVNDYFDNMTPEEREAHAETLRTGVNFISNLMPGAFIPKAVDAVQGFFREQQYKDVMAKEAEKNEADRLKAESDNLLRMIQETNKSIYSPPVESRTAPVTPESEQVQQAIADTNFAGMDRGSTPTQERTPDTQAVQNDINRTDFSGMDRGNTAPPSAPTPSTPSSDPGNGGGAGGVGGGGQNGGDSRGGYSNANAGNYGWSRSGGGEGGGWAAGGPTHGGIANLHQYNLGSYSDGGRLLKGPGDGVSDDIPATIGHGQPARLADGEFVVPARIVSELGNGSTDAGARELYKMMDRIQAGRKKTVGKDQVAKNSKSARHLPA
jgi:hypothetical protein